MNQITIIIPTYNRLAYLKEAIESCISQTLLPIEIIIGDDSSNGDTEQWIKKYISPNIKISYYHHQPSLKQADNVEFLIQQVKTEWMLLLHDDDALLPNALEDLYKVIDSHKNRDVVFGKQLIMDDKGKVDENASNQLNLNYKRTANYHLKNLNSLEVALTQQLPSNSFLMKTDLAKMIHYNHKEKAGDAVDFYFCLLLAHQNVNFVFTDTFVSKYRITENSVSTNSNAGYFSFKLVEQFKTKNEYEKNLQFVFLKNRAPMAIMEALKMNDKKFAKEIFWSQYHKDKIWSLGGVKRALKIYF